MKKRKRLDHDQLDRGPADLPAEGTTMNVTAAQILESFDPRNVDLSPVLLREDPRSGESPDLGDPRRVLRAVEETGTWRAWDAAVQAQALELAAAGKLEAPALSDPVADTTESDDEADSVYELVAKDPLDKLAVDFVDDETQESVIV